MTESNGGRGRHGRPMGPSDETQRLPQQQGSGEWSGGEWSDGAWPDGARQDGARQDSGRPEYGGPEFGGPGIGQSPGMDETQQLPHQGGGHREFEPAGSDETQRMPHLGSGSGAVPSMPQPIPGPDEEATMLHPLPGAVFVPAPEPVPEPEPEPYLPRVGPEFATRHLPEPPATPQSAPGQGHFGASGPQALPPDGYWPGSSAAGPLSPNSDVPNSDVPSSNAAEPNADAARDAARDAADDPSDILSRLTTRLGTNPAGDPAADSATNPAADPEATTEPGAAPPAPVRTGSPIRYPGLQPALLTTGLAALLALCSLAGRPGLVVAVLALQVLTGAGWFRLNGMWPARQGIAVAVLAGVAADAAILAASAGGVWSALVGVLGIGLLAVLIQQMVQRAPKGELTEAMTATVVATGLTVLAAAWFPLRALTAPKGAVEWVSGAALTTTAAAVATTLLVRAALLALGRATDLPMEVVSLLCAAAAATVTGAAVGAAALHMPAGSGAVIGLVAGLGALIGHRVASYDFPSRFVHLTAGVALPLTCAVLPAYLAGWVLTS